MHRAVRQAGGAQCFDEVNVTQASVSWMRCFGRPAPAALKDLEHEAIALVIEALVIGVPEMLNAALYPDD